MTPSNPRAAAPAEILRSELGRCTVLSPVGPLDRALGVRLRTAVQTEFAFHPRPLVCDLSSVPVVDVAAVPLLAAAAESCGGWPLVHLALAAPQPSVARTLRRSGASRFLVLRDTVEQAERDVLARPPKLRARLSVLPGLEAMVTVRRFVADCCLRWRLTGAGDDVTEAMTAMLRLAAAHGRGQVRLTVDYDGRQLRASLRLQRASGRGSVPDQEAVTVAAVDGTLLLTVALPVLEVPQEDEPHR